MSPSVPGAPVGVGDPAPDFTLDDTHGTPVRLGALRGAPVLVVFVPFAFSGRCTQELCELRDNLGELEGSGVRLLVVSCDATFSLRAWAEQEGYTFALLSDFWPHGEVARAYGVFDEAHGLALRGSFLVDAEGVVRWCVRNPRGVVRDLADYRAAVAALPGAPA
ncbi:peroxiredoxin [Cellulomonas cellasea]|uniref:Alkyl hydroperoxide reductase E n=1 Tax=Cellulomonas cellasea TaxID=43670 RepID=A0A7W4YAJ4_9CELL|nr:peroxiredoxin [Cellulomonas cellasea]MBB2921491.1 peroxiredoxin [Cellulomonas cellasea]